MRLAKLQWDAFYDQAREFHGNLDLPVVTLCFSAFEAGFVNGMVEAYRMMMEARHGR